MCRTQELDVERLTNGIKCHYVPNFSNNGTSERKMAEPALQADVQLGAQGRLVVPAALRKALGFEAGEILLARVEDGRLVVEKAEAIERRVYERFEKVKGRSLADELIAERREEARREAGR